MSTDLKSSLKSSLALSAPALILALALAIGLNQVGSGFAARSSSGIVVTGSARVGAVADNVVWNLNVGSVSPTLAAAVKSVDEDLIALEKYLRDGGIPASALGRGAISTYANEEYVNGNPTGRILNYKGNRSLTVRTSDVQLVAKLSNEIGSLISQGVEVSNYGPSYYISSLQSLRPELLKEAMIDAQTRAKAIVESFGGSVGGVIAVRSGVFQVTSPDSVETSGEGYYDTSTIEKTVTATVSVTFANK
jgi:hypothetical protein